ncbi:MAG: hypothetical protein ORN98_00660, partial [Alphaproteobacteria bacterium]|nr:hypothetical protein [Alphaproteobacteria bacterium]
VGASAGTAYGVSADAMNSTGGKVSIRQHGNVTGSATVVNGVAMGVALSGDVTATMGIAINQGYGLDNSGNPLSDGKIVSGNAASGISFTGNLSTSKGDINVSANGSVSGAGAVYGLNSNNATLTASNGAVGLSESGAISSTDGTVTGLNQLGSISASGTITATNDGTITANKGAVNGMVLSNLSSYRGITVTESADVTNRGTGTGVGSNTANGLVLNGTLWSAGSISATQSGDIEVKIGAVAKGVVLNGVRGTAHNDITITQSGTIKDGSFGANTPFTFTASPTPAVATNIGIDVASGSTLSGSAAGYSWVSLRSNNLNLKLEGDLTVAKAELRIDLYKVGKIDAGTNLIAATGLNAYYSGADASYAPKKTILVAQ